jgi:hypothetical protein
MAETTATASPAAAPSAPAPAAAPAAAPAPAPAAPAPAPSVPPSEPAAAAATSIRPTWLPETHWDPKLNAINLGALQKDFETKAALAARKPEDIKFAPKLPDDFKPPEGMKVKFGDERDLRVPVLRDIALRHGLPQEAVDEMLIADARFQIAQIQAEGERLANEDKKLGPNHQARKDAVLNWLKAAGLEPDEAVALAMGVRSAHGVTALEKLMARQIGAVPSTSAGGGGPAPAPAPEKTLAQRLYPNMVSSERKAG